MISFNNNENLILEIQNYLINIRNTYPSLPLIEPTGVYDQETRNAVIAFQNIKGLPPTGSVDLRTGNELVRENNEYLRRTQTPVRIPFSSSDFQNVKIGDQRDLVYALKIMLNSFNRRFSNYIELQITDIYDEKTEEVVRLFQERSMLPVTGIVDIETWNALVNIYDCCRFYN